MAGGDQEQEHWLWSEPRGLGLSCGRLLSNDGRSGIRQLRSVLARWVVSVATPLPLSTPAPSVHGGEGHHPGGPARGPGSEDVSQEDADGK